MLSGEELENHIRGCSLNKRESQKIIYCAFYGYAYAICSRYTNKQEDATEILNDGFLKIYKQIHKFKPAYSDIHSSFKGWLSKIMVYTAIDHNRKYYKHDMYTVLDGKVVEMPSSYENALDKISYDEIILAVKNLSPAYRTVFNLFIIEGFTHQEIGRILHISPGTSKSNLSKARRQLQKYLFHQKSVQKKNVI
ncbi:sigma-70 family RNA polymerase sigma factor [soil metagenome]